MTIASRSVPVLIALLVSGFFMPAVLPAQGAHPPGPDSLPTPGALGTPRSDHYWRDFALGAATSLLLHEAGHVGTSIALGARPSFGFDRGRPTVYSGIDPITEPRKQFLFSSMGLDLQSLLDELILDVPHQRGAPFERGVLAAGVGTALFYVTLGRSAAVSDIDLMSRTSSLSKTDLTAIYGGVALVHLLRIRHDGRYAHFFVRPAPRGAEGLRIGVRVE
ncbi:MAG TPA: hypothetical protein VFY85_04650 [Gemmatimonadaceae bacterium]|nr:hypothetical protein [Gemmatimonadaceae bacterium]